MSYPYTNLHNYLNRLPQFHSARVEGFKAITKARRLDIFRLRARYMYVAWFVIGIFIGSGFSC